MTYNDAWQEKCWVTITEKGASGTKHHFRAYTRDISIKYGAKDGEGVATLSGGRIWKYTPEGDSEVTMSVYAIKGVDDPKGPQLFAGNTTDTSDPIQVTNSITRKDVRLTILWSQNAPASNEADGVPTTGGMRRVFFKNARVTNYEEDFSTDEVLKGSITVKVPPYDASGNGSITWESTEDIATNALSAMGDYT